MKVVGKCTREVAGSIPVDRADILIINTTNFTFVKLVIIKLWKLLRKTTIFYMNENLHFKTPSDFQKIPTKNTRLFVLVVILVLAVLGAGYYFLHQKLNIFYKNNFFNKDSSLVNSGPESLITLDQYYAKDSNHVYYNGKILDGADAKSFSLYNGLAKDKNSVFWGDKIINVEIDPSSATKISNKVIKDKTHVYFRQLYDADGNFIDEKINGPVFKQLYIADASTFQYVGECTCVEIICHNYYKDKNNVFVEETPLENIDSSSFQYFGYYSVHGNDMPVTVSYSKDKNTVYKSCGDILKDADVNTFENIGDGYAKDKNYVWNMAKLINGADSLTFKVLSDGYAKDKDKVYFDGSIINNVDTSSFDVVEEKLFDKNGNEIVSAYGKDKSHVYKFGKVVENVDPKNCTRETISGCLNQ